MEEINEEKINWLTNIGKQLIKSVEISIGGISCGKKVYCKECDEYHNSEIIFCKDCKKCHNSNRTCIEASIWKKLFEEKNINKKNKQLCLTNFNEKPLNESTKLYYPSFNMLPLMKPIKIPIENMYSKQLLICDKLKKKENMIENFDIK